MRSFQSLKVISLQLKTDGTKIVPTTRQLIDLTSAFKPESCARQVFIFNAFKNQIEFDQCLNLAASKTKACQYFTGFSAYAYLLSWVVGGEYREKKRKSKLPLFNDNHILGKFKQNWNQFKKNNLANKNVVREYARMIDPLLEDAHQIRQKIESKHYGEGWELRNTLNIVIQNVIFSRSNSLPVLYDHIHKNNHEYAALLNQFISERIKNLEIQLSTHAGSSFLLDSPARKGIFNRLITYCRQNKLLAENAIFVNEAAESPHFLTGDSESRDRKQLEGELSERLTKERINVFSLRK